MGYARIVVGTDGSETAGRAVDRAARLSKDLGSTLILVTASAPIGMIDTVAEEIAVAARDRVRAKGIEAEAVVQEGDPAEVLTAVAAAQDAGLVVVGDQGLGRARRFRLGGVAERVAVMAPCDVLIVETQNPREEPPEGPLYRRLLVGTDGSPTATAAVQRAYDFGMMIGVGVLVATVTDDDVLAAIHLEDARKIKPRALGVEAKVLRGEPAKALVKEADREGCELIVVGNRGLTGARRVLLGSIPSRVAHRADRDVLIARTVGRTIKDLRPGQGAVVDAGSGKMVAAFLDEDGGVLALDPRCTHMGCTVRFNQSERTWDCPCHGSRYDLEGQVLQGPAKKPLSKTTL
ncbi:MAG TPA: universal stress protein [Actinomycetota bacterium]